MELRASRCTKSISHQISLQHKKMKSSDGTIIGILIRFRFDSLIKIESISFEKIENFDYCPALKKLLNISCKM